MEVPVEEILACLGFTIEDNPLARARHNQEILDAVSHFTQTHAAGEALLSQQREIASKLMDMMVGASFPAVQDSKKLNAADDALLGAEAAAQILAMVAADEKNNTHSLHVDKWISSCLSILKKCKPSTTEGSASSLPSESLVVCASSCLADLMNNPQSTFMCTTRAPEIFHSLQRVLLLSNLKNRMVYFQACRGISEVLHPTTWPMHKVATVPQKLLDRFVHLLAIQDPSPDASPDPTEPQGLPPEGLNGLKLGKDDVSETGAGAADGQVLESAATAEEGEAEAKPASSGILSEEDLIQMQAAKALLVMATNGAAPLIIENAPDIVEALQRLHKVSVVEEVVVQADAALMALWLSEKAYRRSPAELRPVVVRNLLWALGSEDLVDIHQNCSLALVAASMMVAKATRDEMLGIYSNVLTESPQLVQVLIGHIEDAESLAHQSMVYFMLHLAESESCSRALLADPSNVENLVHVLATTAASENHHAPVAILTNLMFHDSARSLLAPHLTAKVLLSLRNIQGPKAHAEVELLLACLPNSGKEFDTNTRKDIWALYRENADSQVEFLRSIIPSRRTSQPHRRSKSDGEEPALLLRAELGALPKCLSVTDTRSGVESSPDEANLPALKA